MGLPASIWLASKSPRRKELISTLGIHPEVFLAQTGPEAERLEDPLPGEDPLVYVQRVTRLKLQLAMESLKLAIKNGERHSLGCDIVLASDTTVALNGKILGKPQNASEAQSMLSALSGQTHQVHTGVAVGVIKTGAMFQTVQTSDVGFARLPSEFIQAYISSGEPFDKAGAYGIQGIAGRYVRRISGSHSGIMGLPLFETAELLRQAVSNQE
ncbi:MAG: Maf family protein [Limnobacter sp.]|nr:Maf family protein [Limnobacter sp.]